MKSFAKVSRIWKGKLVEPDDQNPLRFSRKEMDAFGGDQKINFTVDYDTSDLGARGNISIALVYDKRVQVGQTDLKNLSGAGRTDYRMQLFPDNQRYDALMQPGEHTIDITIRLRKVWTFTSLSEQTLERKIIITE